MVVIPPNPESQLSRPILQVTLVGAFWIRIFSTGMLVDLDPVLERDASPIPAATHFAGWQLCLVDAMGSVAGGTAVPFRRRVAPFNQK